MRPSTRTRAKSALAARSIPALPMKTTPTSAKETSTPANSGPTRVPTLSTVEVAALDAMSSSGVLASDGSSACNAGLISVDETPNDPGEHEHEDWFGGEGRRGRRGKRARADKRHRKQKALATEAVAQRRGEWGNRRRGQQADEAGDADRRSTAPLVRKHAKRDEMRPLSADSCAPRELHPPDVVVPNSHA